MMNSFLFRSKSQNVTAHYLNKKVQKMNSKMLKQIIA